MMQTPNTATLRQWTEAVNARVAEEFELFNIPIEPPVLSPGIIRAAWEVMAGQIAAELTPATAGERIEIRAPAFTLGRDEMLRRIDALSDESANTSTVTSAPESATNMPCAGESEAGNEDSVAVGSAAPAQPTRKSRYSRVNDIPPEELKARAYEFIRGLAHDGIMPRYADYEAARPEGLPTRVTLLQRLGLSWREVAEELGLTMLTPIERMKQSNQAKAAAEEPAQAPQPLQPSIPPVQVVPARVVESEPLKPQPAERNHIEQQAFERRKLRVDLFDCLRKIAVDGVMPTVDEYHARKPDALPNANDVMNRLGYMGWHEVAKDLGLVTKARRAAEKAVAARRKRLVA
jgi:hypothetical protein